MGPRFERLGLLLIAKLRLFFKELTDAINVERLRDDEVEILAVTGVGERVPGRSAVIAIILGRSRPCNSLLAVVATCSPFILGR